MKQVGFRIGRVLALAGLLGALFFATLGGAFADSPSPKDGTHGFFGQVTAKGEAFFTLQTKQGSTMMLKVTQDTHFFVPGKEEAGFADLAIGSRVAVLASIAGGSTTALRVMMVPGEPQRQHRVLMVSQISGNTVIAEDLEGNRVVVELDHELSSDIQGQLVIFIGQHSQQSNRFKANAEVKIQQVIKRLEAQAQRLEAEVKAEAHARTKAEKSKDMAQLKSRLEALMQQHLELFAEIIAKAPEEAKPSLEAALDMSLKGYLSALEALGHSQTEAKAKLTIRNLHGSVAGVDTANSMLTIILRDGSSTSLHVTQGTKIRIDGKVGSLGAIPTGSRVNVRYNSDTSTALEVHTESKAKVEGTITGIDTTNHHLTLQLTNGATLTLSLTFDTEIEVNGKETAEADLSVGLTVEVKYDPGTMAAQEIEAETSAEIEGTIQAVDIAAGTVTIMAEDGISVVLKVSDATQVKVKGLLFGLLVLKPGMDVEAKFDLATSQAFAIKAETGEPPEDNEDHKGLWAAGIVTTVNASEGEFTLQLDNGGTLTLSTNSETEFDINHSHATLADLEAGMQVQVEYNLEMKMALEVEASHSHPNPSGHTAQADVNISANAQANNHADESHGEGRADAEAEAKAGVEVKVEAKLSP